MSQDLEKFGMPEEELFAPVDHSDLESEKITAPRYSYWHSVFRVFFKKKINIIILAILGVLIAFTYLYPLFVEYDKFGNLMDATTKHLSPSAAIERLGMNIHWILGTGAAGQSTFDAYGLDQGFPFPLHLSVQRSTFPLVLLSDLSGDFQRKWMFLCRRYITFLQTFHTFY